MRTVNKERAICFHLLRKDELIYEVKIRDAVPEHNVVALRKHIRTLATEIPTDVIV